MTLLVGGVPDVDLGQIFVFRALCGEAIALRGGELVIRWTEDTVYMTGPATLVFTGEVEV